MRNLADQVKKVFAAVQQDTPRREEPGKWYYFYLQLFPWTAKGYISSAY